MERINICLACDENYAKHAGASIASCLINADIEDEFVFYILGYNLSDETKHKLSNLKKIKNCTINIIEPEIELFKEFKDLKTVSHITIPAYFRLKIADFVQEIDKILYLDCDTIVKRNIRDLYDTNINEYPLAGVKDIGSKSLNININSGVLLINLKKWREEKLYEKFIEYAINKREEIKMGDQEIINNVCRGEILELPSEWNFQALNFYCLSSYERKYGIIHYIGASKPWHWGSFMPFKKDYFECLARTDWQCPSSLWLFFSNVYSYLKYWKRKPFFFMKKQFIKTLKSGVFLDI